MQPQFLFHKIALQKRLRKIFILAVTGCLVTISSTSLARGLSQTERCLRLSNTDAHECIEKSLTTKKIPHCYQLAKAIKSSFAKEIVHNYCFYAISDFPSLNSCMEAASKFTQAVNKDAALFECYRQFASQMNAKQCHAVADRMTFSDKQAYLKQGCDNL